MLVVSAASMQAQSTGPRLRCPEGSKCDRVEDRRDHRENLRDRRENRRERKRERIADSTSH
jgi:hypothetical protein